MSTLKSALPLFFAIFLSACSSSGSSDNPTLGGSETDESSTSPIMSTGEDSNPIVNLPAEDNNSPDNQEEGDNNSLVNQVGGDNNTPINLPAEENNPPVNLPAPIDNLPGEDNTVTDNLPGEDNTVTDNLPGEDNTVTDNLPGEGNDLPVNLPGEEDNTPGAEMNPELLNTDWTLETVRGVDGQFRPLPLEMNATWTLNFAADGSVGGNAQCNNGGGNWQADDVTLSISSWIESQIGCSTSNQVPTETQDILSRFFAGETVMHRLDAGRLFLDTGDNAQLVFSGRPVQANEQVVTIETLLQTIGGSRASDGSPVFGDLDSPYIVYRDAQTLNADLALLPDESVPATPLPEVDFTNSIVIGAYLPLDGQIRSRVVVRSARVSETGLEIETARFGPDVLDENSGVNCAADDALSAPYTLVRIESLVEPVNFTEVARAFCSGIPPANQ